MKSTAQVTTAAFTLLVAPDAQAAPCGCGSGSTTADTAPMCTDGDHVGFVAAGTPRTDENGVHRTARLASSAC